MPFELAFCQPLSLYSMNGLWYSKSATTKESEVKMKNEMGQGIQYVVMPLEILQNEDLTPSEKILYCYLTLFKKGVCFQSNSGIEKMTGLQEKTISRGLKKLAELGYIYIEYVNGNSAARRIYTILDNPKKLEYLAKVGAFKGATKPSPETVEEAEDEPEPKNMADDLASRGIVRRSDYATDEEFEKALYKRNTVTV